MPGFRGSNPTYAGVAGADLENAPQGPVPFTSPYGLPVTRMQLWHAGGSVPGTGTGVPGTPVQRASGNPGIATVPGSVQQSPYGGIRIGNVHDGGPPYPGPGPYGGTGQGNAGLPNSPDRLGGVPQFGSPRALNVGQESSFRGPGGGVGSANDKMITYDRHLFAKVGYENSGRDSGQTDPPLDGPPRPSYQVLNRAFSYQQGTDTTLTQDDLSRDYARTTMGPTANVPGYLKNPLGNGRFSQYQGRESATPYKGEQGTGWSPIYGGVPGLYQPYGSYAGVSAGPVQGIQSPVAQGAVGDGTRRVWSGPPHGLHSPTLPAYSQTIGRYTDIPQMHAPRVDRPSNSPIAGQTYSQTVQMQGQQGTVPQNPNINSGVNFNQRVSGNGWRGRGQG